jgi:pimeloyl-ACP methyl ester carboxylesterase
MAVLHYKALGEPQKPALLILHGLFGMLNNWQTLGRWFSQFFRVYLVDLRNHGKSFHSLAFDYYVMAEDIVTFMDDLHLETAYVIGHSMGGKTAMQVAVEQPDRIAKLVVVDIAPKDYPRGHDAIFEAFFSIDLRTIKNRKMADILLQQQIPDFAVRQFLLKNLRRTKQGGYHWKANLEAIFYAYDDILANSLSPHDEYPYASLFVKGGNSDRYIQLATDMPHITQYFPKAQVKIVPNAGHWVHAEQPQIFYTMVLKFLQS